MAQEKAPFKVWRLRRGMDRRFRSGHPWVYSNELEESPKGIEPGEWVELRDSSGKFLARGFGNPRSLISFRSLSRDPEALNLGSPEDLSEILIKAGKLRMRLGLGDVSHRLCFGEVDGIPGLVIDRYRIRSGQVFVVQAHTAGADRLLPLILDILERYVRAIQSQSEWGRTSVILRNDLSVRKLEGLLEQEPQVIQKAPGLELQRAQILVRSVLGGEPIEFRVDLLEGQKTGFFLDQSANIELAALRLKHLAQSQIRILDLCCYVGQWGTQLARVFRTEGSKVEVVAVDASAQALELARQNVESQGAKCETLKADVLKGLEHLPSQGFDIVISDPPALIKSRKDIPAGTHAYLQLATQAMRLVKADGGIVCCSCSALLEEESFTQVLSKAAYRNSTQVRWVGRGSQSPDHPILSEFPEGRYLKGWIGIASKRD